ncbi:MAG: helix-turn-helix domain-containing protein [Oscillospiraceae bacterium]
MDSEKELGSLLFYHLDNGRFHRAYTEEFGFYELVKQGNLEEIRKFRVLHIDPDAPNYAKLSDDPLRSLTYHFVILAAMLARACTEGGMNREKAFSLSDLYIRAADKCRSVAVLQQLHEEMILDYTMRMKFVYRETLYSKPVSLCLAEIERSLTRRVTTESLARVAGVSRSHLSRLFRKETGTTLTDYILRQKTEAAANMLRLSGKSCAEVAACFGFSSQSHFSRVFKKYTGQTPAKRSR